MNLVKYLLVALIIALPTSIFAQLENTELHLSGTDSLGNDAWTYYDLRDRSTYVQLSHLDPDYNVDGNICVHIQIFQQDQGCDELNFEDELTENDTVVYDMDDLFRNDGSEVPINLDEDSYGIVTISSFICGDPDTDADSDVLLGNVRIIDNAGYEYRMNLANGASDPQILGSDGNTPQETKIIIPFNTVDGANQADVIAFVIDEDRLSSGQTGTNDQYNIYNEEVGVSFDVFQFDENEEPLSCDRKTFGCGPNVTLNYGINEDYPNSRGGPLLCEGASLLPGQQHGFISLENIGFLSPIDNVPSPVDDNFELFCAVGLNNGDGTGSMDECRAACFDGDGPGGICQD